MSYILVFIIGGAFGAATAIYFERKYKVLVEKNDGKD